MPLFLIAQLAALLGVPVPFGLSLTLVYAAGSLFVRQATERAEGHHGSPDRGCLSRGAFDTCNVQRTAPNSIVWNIHNR